MFSLVEDLLGFLFSKLPTYQLVIITFLLQKLEMFTLLDDLSFENLICSLLNQLLGLGINGGSGLIQNENSGVCQNCSCKGDQLFFSG